MKDKIIKNIPNALTLSRIISSIAGAIAFVSGNIPLAAELYIYGAVSDFFDGLAARKLNAFSELGRKLDAFSDKIYAGSLLVPSILCGNWLMLIPYILELKIAQINLKSQKMGFKPETQRIGKFKTALLFPTMIIGLLATVSFDFQPLLWLLIPATTVLQSKSIIAYENLLKYNINKQHIEEDNLAKNTFEDDNSQKVNIITKESSKKNVYTYNKSMNLVEEMIFYMTVPYFEEDYDSTVENKINKSHTKIKRRLK